MPTGKWIRAARRARGLSQRELAEATRIPASTISRIEADANVPRFDTVVALLAPLGYELVIVDAKGNLLVPDADHDVLRDRGGRRFPAHLKYGRVRDYFDPLGRNWWGWERIAWPFGLGWVPEFTYWHRPRGTWLWDDAT